MLYICCLKKSKYLTLKNYTMKRLLLILAVSGLVFASCGKKAEPVVEPTPAPQEVVAPAPTPEPTPTPAPEPTPAPKKKETVKPAETKTIETKTIETKAVDANTATQKGQVKTAPAKPKVLTLEEKLKIFDQLSPEEQKEVLRQVEEQKNGGTTTKTKKRN